MAFQALCFERLQTPHETPEGDLFTDTVLCVSLDEFRLCFSCLNSCLSKHNPLLLIFLTVPGLYIHLTSSRVILLRLHPFCSGFVKYYFFKFLGNLVAEY